MTTMIGPRKVVKSPRRACCVCCRHSKREAWTRCASWAARWLPKDEGRFEHDGSEKSDARAKPEVKSACACNGRTKRAPPKRLEKSPRGLCRADESDALAVSGLRAKCPA